jgi:hypothetical protein
VRDATKTCDPPARSVAAGAVQQKPCDPRSRVCPRLSSLWQPAARYRQRPEPPRRPGPPRPPSPLWGPRARPALPHPPRPQSVDSQLDQTLEASLSPPCTRGLTASPRRRRITGGQRTRLTPTLAFAPSNAPFQARRRGSRGRRDGADAGRPRAAGVNRSYAPPRASATAILLHLARPCGNSIDLRRRPTPFPRKSIRTGHRAIRLTREDTVAPNRGVIAAALLLGIALAVALPGAGLGAAGAGSEAEPRALVPQGHQSGADGPFLPRRVERRRRRPGSLPDRPRPQRLAIACNFAASTPIQAQEAPTHLSSTSNKRNGEKAYE